MVGGQQNILILAGRLSRHDARWPLVPWLDRLERRGCRLQILCLSRGNVLPDDPRCLEVPALTNRWMRGWVLRSLWTDERLQRPDLVHVIHDELSETALILAESYRLPYVQTVADFRTLGRGIRVSRQWCRQLVAIGADLAAGLIDGLGVPPTRVTVIPPGIAPPESLPVPNSEDRVPVIGAGGPIDEDSGLMVFLEAARQVLDSGRDAEFVIAGQGADHLDLRRRSQHLGIGERVTVAEFPSVGAEYWSALNIYCQPSIVPNAGLTLLQAMAHSVPCIATTADGLKGLIEPGTSGLIVPTDDPVALENAILGLLDHPEEARRLAQNARLRVQTGFDPDAESDRLVELYRQVIGPAGMPE